MAAALTYQGDSVHVYSSNWGPPSTGHIARQPGYVLQMVLKTAVEEVYIIISAIIKFHQTRWGFFAQGRGGKGSIFVFSSGVGGQQGDECSTDGYVNSIYTIAVGSAAHDGSLGKLDEKCSAKIAVTLAMVTYTEQSPQGIK